MSYCNTLTKFGLTFNFVSPNEAPNLFNAPASRRALKAVIASAIEDWAPAGCLRTALRKSPSGKKLSLWSRL